MAGCSSGSLLVDDFELLSLTEGEGSSSSTSPPDTPTGQSPNYKNSRDYMMDHANRGKCIVFNHEHFIHLSERKGTHHDVQRINQTFGNLGFTVEVCDDCDHEAIKSKIKELSEEDHTNNDCIAIFVLTHGEDNSRIHAKNMSYDMEDLWSPFTADRCITLAGKPKMFFFSACRGERRDNGVILYTSERTVTDGPRTSYVVPVEADFVHGFSTPPGYVSYREPSDGTWYIKALCTVFDEYAATTELLEMLTMTNGKVLELTNKSAKLVQVTQFRTTLSRRVLFKPKKPAE